MPSSCWSPLDMLTCRPPRLLRARTLIARTSCPTPQGKARVCRGGDVFVRLKLSIDRQLCAGFGVAETSLEAPLAMEHMSIEIYGIAKDDLRWRDAGR